MAEYLKKNMETLSKMEKSVSMKVSGALGEGRDRRSAHAREVEMLSPRQGNAGGHVATGVPSPGYDAGDSGDDEEWGPPRTQLRGKQRQSCMTPLRLVMLIACVGALVIGLAVGLGAKQEDNASVTGGGSGGVPASPPSNVSPDVPHGASAVAALNSLRKGTHDEDKANALFDKIAGLSGGSKNGELTLEGINAELVTRDLELSSDDMSRLFALIDKDGTGGVSKAEFLSFLLIAGPVVFPGTIDLGGSSPYKYLEYADIVARLNQLKAEYPDLVEVYTAQERFGLKSVGNCGSTGACMVHVLEIRNPVTADEHTPEVFYSGTIHGNERVGPTAVVEFATILLKGYKDGHRWAKRLVDTRRLTIAPCANAIGYFENRREEQGVDPNRDFAWDQSPGSCMQTIAARAINEIYRTHVFQLSATFHGGDNLVAYPWGDNIHCVNKKGYYCGGGWIAPDDTGMNRLTTTIRDFAGGFSGQPVYKTGALNDPAVIYPVSGGMEDWAYAASWNTQGLVECNPSKNGGYPVSKTKYGNATNRAVNLLVETAMMKSPNVNTFGAHTDILNPQGSGNGHIPRNIRLCWVLADSVQPYVDVVNEDEIPSTITEGVAFNVIWRPGGAFSADFTEIFCKDSSKSNENMCTIIDALPQGLSLWTQGVPQPPITTRIMMKQGTAGGAAGGKPVELTIRIKVDGRFTGEGRSEANLGPPQTHFVRARTDDSWYAAAGSSEVHGHAVWSSKPITIQVKDDGLRRKIE